MKQNANSNRVELNKMKTTTEQKLGNYERSYEKLGNKTTANITTYPIGENTGKESKNFPEQTFRAGGISVSVWKNTTKTEGKEYRTVTFERRYLDRDGQWKSSSSLRTNDLPKAAVVLTKAYEYLILRDKDMQNVQEEIVV